MKDTWVAPDLRGTVAVVTGASRGLGRGVALSLAEAGMTIYVTSRGSGHGGNPQNLPETVEETAELIAERGGVGIPVIVDHTQADEVAALFSRVKTEQGKLDLLANNAWGGYENFESWEVPFWEQPLWRWDATINRGVWMHYLASYHAAPIMIEQKRGLIVNTTFFVPGRFLDYVHYDLAKNAINRLAFGMSVDLKPHNVTALALSPGWIRTEHIHRAYGVDDYNAQDHPEMSGTESCFYSGRAILSLWQDPNLMDKSGRTYTAGELARVYGFVDVDGRQVAPFHELNPDKYPNRSPHL